MDETAQLAIIPFDLERMFLGDTPWLFTAEIVFRTVVIYLFALAMIRLVSQRAVGQLSVVEFLLVIALGSAVGDSMFYPDVPLLHAFLVIAVVVILARAIDWFVVHSEIVETLIEGMPRQLVTDGVVDLDALHAAKLNPEMLFVLLRDRGVTNLGEVKAAILEQRGTLTVTRATSGAVRTGLPLMPPKDLRPGTTLARGADVAPGNYGCEACGTAIEFAESGELPTCPACGHGGWTAARRS